MIKTLVFLLLLCISVPCYAVPVTSPFGYRMHPVTGEYRLHTGTDLGYDYGEPIGAIAEGTVAFAGVRGGYGNCVIISHDNGDSTLYGHFSELACQAGDRVARGTVVGYVGSTGMSTGPHLHLEWWHEGVYCDPMPLLTGVVEIAPIDYGGLTFEESKPVEKVKSRKVKPLPKLMPVKDYMRQAARTRHLRHKGELATKIRRLAAFKIAGVLGYKEEKPVVEKKTSGGFDF